MAALRAGMDALETAALGSQGQRAVLKKGGPAASNRAALTPDSVSRWVAIRKNKPLAMPLLYRAFEYMQK
jgi:hypothetical protein